VNQMCRKYYVMWQSKACKEGKELCIFGSSSSYTAVHSMLGSEKTRAVRPENNKDV
jgi:hypothetical protein